MFCTNGPLDVEFVINTTYSVPIGMTPYAALYGQDVAIRTEFDAIQLQNQPSKTLEDWMKKLESIHHLVLSRSEQAAERMKTNYDNSEAHGCALDYSFKSISIRRVNSS